MRNFLLVSALVSVLCLFQAAYGQETVKKVDENSLKQTTEQIYTYEQIQTRVDQLKAERDGQQNNLSLLNAEIARLEKMIQDTGIKAKPIEESDAEEPGE